MGRFLRSLVRNRWASLALLVLHALIATDAAWAIARAIAPMPPAPLAASSPCAPEPRSCCCPERARHAGTCCCAKDPAPAEEDPAAAAYRAGRCSGAAGDAVAGPVRLPIFPGQAVSAALPLPALNAPAAAIHRRPLHPDPSPIDKVPIAASL